MLDASPDELSVLIRRVVLHTLRHDQLCRVLVYLMDSEGLALEAVLDETTREPDGLVTYPARIEMRGRLLDGVTAFAPQPGHLVPATTNMLVGHRDVIAFSHRQDDTLLGLLVLQSETPREWDESWGAALTELLVRALRRFRLARSQETETYLMDTLMQHLPDAIYFKDARSRFIRASRQVVTQNGFLSFAELSGKTDFDLFTQEHAAQAFRDEELVMRSGTPIIAKEEKETWPDGRVTWVLTTKMPFRDQHGHTIGTFGMSRDITQLRLTQAALLESQEMLRQRYQAMENDLAQARIIQMALLPQAPPEYKQLQIRFRYEPLDAIGGDFFSFRRLPDGGLAVFLGDLTGHGVSAALFMSLIRCMTERVFETDGSEPRTYVQALDQALMGQIPHGFITAVYCVLEPQPDGTVKLIWCGAGHPDPIIWRKSTGITEQIPGGDGAIGIFENFPREQRTMILEPGDRLFLYTDGIPETQTPEGNMLGFESVGACIEEATKPDLEKTLTICYAESGTSGGTPPPRTTSPSSASK
jgi:PAS domain S-box-containing protein